MSQNAISVPQTQRGAALLLMMLLLVTAAAYALISRISTVHVAVYRDQQTAMALAQAKEALLGYAASYPEMASSPPPEKGPGYLPCPDNPSNDTTPSNVGMPSSSCALSTGTSLGRLPWRYLGLPDLRDGSGERLWYAVSDNYRYNSGATIMNSDTPGDLIVDGKSDIVAVIFAPGDALSGQARSMDPTQPGYSDVTAYLEGENATPSDKVFASSGTGDFNDRVAVITRAELMSIVEKRVIGTVAQALTNFRVITPPIPDPNSRFPWPTPFADPKLATPTLAGTATTGSGGVQLYDSTHDFTKWAIQTGDVVRDLTDGSMGRVSTTPATTSLTVSGLTGGATNAFALNDSYVIVPSAISSQLSGVADSGSGGLTLSDAARDFSEVGVDNGDVIDDTLDGSRGIIDDVNATTLTAKSLIGGTTNTFKTNDGYLIKSDVGRNTSLGSSLSLTDSANNFVGIGIQINDVAENLTTHAVGAVTSVASTVLGTSISFNPGDYYRLPRLTTPMTPNANEGLLAIHEEGKPFLTGFTANWNLSNYTPSVSFNGSPPSISALTDSYKNFVQSSTLSGPINVPSQTGFCFWTTVDQATCNGSYTERIVTGIGGAGGTNTLLVDASKTFSTWGITRGDRVTDTTDGSYGVVDTVGASTLSAMSLNFGTSNKFSTGDNYRVSLATDTVTGTVLVAIPPNKFIVQGLNPTDITSYDVIENTTQTPSSFGLVAPTPISSPPFLTITYTPLQGGSGPSFNTGDTFTVWRHWIDKRSWSFQINLRGAEDTQFVNGERVRNIKVTNAPLPIQPSPYTVQINDSDASGALLGSATIDVASTGTGTLELTGIHFDLRTDGSELAPWFINNKWQRLTYIAIAPGFVPGGSGTCTPGVDCLTLKDNSSTLPALVRNDIQAMVISTGAALSSQDRTIGCLPFPDGCTKSQVSPPIPSLLSQYLEGGNEVPGTTTFYEGTRTDTFNDQVRVIAP